MRAAESCLSRGVRGVRGVVFVWFLDHRNLAVSRDGSGKETVVLLSCCPVVDRPEFWGFPRGTAGRRQDNRTTGRQVAPSVASRDGASVRRIDETDEIGFGRPSDHRIVRLCRLRRVGRFRRDSQSAGSNSPPSRPAARSESSPHPRRVGRGMATQNNPVNPANPVNPVKNSAPSRAGRIRWRIFLCSCNANLLS